MAVAADKGAPADPVDPLQRVADLLGGADALRHELVSPLDAHEMLLQGLPGTALRHLVDNLVVIRKTGSLEKAVGMSLRTFQRHKEKPDQPLSVEQSGRTWKFAEILDQATRVFGSQKAAEEWLESPAMALNQRRPIDLLATPAGLDMVETLLGQLEYCVYI